MLWKTYKSMIVKDQSKLRQRLFRLRFRVSQNSAWTADSAP